MRARYAILLTALASCTKAPVEWGDIVYRGAPHQPSEFPALAEPLPPNACPGSLRIAKAGNSEYAAWWEPREDGSAVLMSARRHEGESWSPTVADSTDRSTNSCGRFPPAIAADSSSGYVHVAYFAEPKSGSGIFFAHSMDSAKTFHSPVAIVYGRNPSRVSIASSGDRLVVAYEDPNATQPAVGVALSNTMGHIFERRVTASGANGVARQPVVRLAGDSIRVWWSEYSTNPTISATRPMYRAGKWKQPEDKK